MKTHILDFPVVIEPDTETGTGKPGFSAYCPSLGVADDGDTIDAALANIRETIKFHLECLKAEGETVPHSRRSLFTSVQIPFSGKLATS
jgi:predicted RNase H-like HicB family nuclease